jgi:hypothetical protein
MVQRRSAACGASADTRADVRVAIVDGCQSGALVGKGGARAPGFEIRLIDQLDASGEAMLTSSAADELALESREIRGSFFTHHLVSGCSVPTSDPNFAEACVDGPGRALRRAIIAGLVGTAVGSSLIAGGLAVNPHPVEIDEVRRLADEHNVALRRRLADPPPRAPPSDSLLTFYVAPGAGSTALGLTLGVAF